jgi:hypothetical protein
MTAPGTLQPGELMPHLEVRTTTGAAFSYASIWQRLNLVQVK